MSEIYQEMAWIVMVGLVATAVMDVISLLRVHVLGERAMDWALVGRWLGHVLRGQLVLTNPRTAGQVPYERALGWLFHYGVGLALAALMWAILGGETLQRPQLAPIVGFGAATVVLPMLTMQPGLGMGVAARKLPAPWAARARSLVTHLSFGFGLYLGAVMAAAALG